ncbi:MAG: GNAT family N-acetyltransferase [Rubrobacteraceae bacterium]
MEEDSETKRAGYQVGNNAEDGSGPRVRPMTGLDLENVEELRSVVRWSTDPRAFGLLRGFKGARWAVTGAPDGSLTGMVGAVPLGEIGVLCHLAVSPEHRGQGLGARLSSWAVSYLRSQGARTVRLDSTSQAENLYRSLGFRSTTPRTVYRKEGARPGPVAKEDVSGYRVSPLVTEDLPELYGVDRWSFGADRSALIFAILRLHPGMGLVARDASGRIKGYLVRGSAGKTTRIGPLMAETPEVARLLLDRALQTGGGAPIEVVVPNGGPAHRVLEEFGFTGRVDRLRMELGNCPVSPAGLGHYATTPYLAT